MRFLTSVLVVCTGVICSATHALALSCMRPDIARTMENAKQSETLYYIFVGTLTSDHPIEPRKPDYENQFNDRRPELTRVRFNGHSLAQWQYRDVPLRNFTMDVETRCFGPWCSGVPVSEKPQIMFVEANPEGVPVLRTSPCPERVFHADPEGENLRKLRTCFDKECLLEEPDYR